MVLAHSSSASADPSTVTTPDPTSWPSSALSDPSLDTWPNAIRIWGDDRYQTSLAASLTLRSANGYPYESPNPDFRRADISSPRAAWVGAGRCPRSIIIVAGDSPADALTATSLSDSSGYSSEPYLRRVAAGDPLFDPIGGYKRVDTDFAPLILTESARNGATGLSPTALLAAQDMRNGGCVTARDAIIVGGWSAVPVEAEQQLLASGYDSIFRVFGRNRFATAAAVAHALGTGSAPEGIDNCLDSDLTDGALEGAFYGNSVVEWRKSVGSCELLENTVVLADGISGVDALAAGWWTSFWQVPVLLHDGSGSLPVDTALAMQTLDIDNVIVLGGTARISSAVMTEIQEISGVTPRRIAGANRYETSVAMARYLGGWWNGGSDGVARGSTLCLVGSSGQGSMARGWPDALTAGAWCAINSWAASGTGAPHRLIPPANGLAPRWNNGSKSPGRAMSPILLINPGSRTIPASVSVLLAESFDSGALWCSSRSAPSGCNDPGFAVIFGGTASVRADLAADVSLILGGGPDAASGAVELVKDSIFLTGLDMSPIFHQKLGNALKICGLRGAFMGTRWVSVGSNPEIEGPSLKSVDLASGSWYRFDVDGKTRSPGISSPGCVELDPSWVDSAFVTSTGVDGRRSQPLAIDLNSSARYEFESPIQVANPQFEAGIGSHINSGSGETRLTFSHSSGTGVTAKFGNKAGPISAASITVTIRRGRASGGHSALFEGSWNLSSVHGTAIGQVAGEAKIVAGTWQLRGRSTVTGGTWPDFTGFGGFNGSLNFNSESPNDDVFNWRIDGTLG